MARNFRGTFKRKRATSSFSGRPFKRRRRTFKRSAPKIANYTSLATKASGSGFRSKKISRGAWKSHLWNSTLFKTHYRSVSVQSTNWTTPVTNVNGTVTGFDMEYDSTNAFWTTLGGAIPVDTGFTLPTFTGNVILRGGTWDFTIINTSDNTLKVKLWLLNSIDRPDFTIQPTIAPVTWDPTVVSDWISRIGKPYLSKEVIINTQESWQMSKKFKIKKIDEDRYFLKGYSPLVFILVSSPGANIASPYTVLTGYNLSFSAETN